MPELMAVNFQRPFTYLDSTGRSDTTTVMIPR